MNVKYLFNSISGADIFFLCGSKVFYLMTQLSKSKKKKEKKNKTKAIEWNERPNERNGQYSPIFTNIIYICFERNRTQPKISIKYILWNDKTKLLVKFFSIHENIDDDFSKNKVKRKEQILNRIGFYLWLKIRVNNTYIKSLTTLFNFPLVLCIVRTVFWSGLLFP